MSTHAFYKSPMWSLFLSQPLMWHCARCKRAIWRRSRALELEGQPCDRRMR